MNKIHSKEWFLNRIGKRVFRDATSCKCQHCKDIVENGLVIGSDLHAIYLFDCQNEMEVFYRDKK